MAISESEGMVFNQYLLVEPVVLVSALKGKASFASFEDAAFLPLDFWDSRNGNGFKGEHFLRSPA
jgi:hypothetical protein